MTQTDPRPPLRLTAHEAEGYFATHSGDIGREVIIVPDPVVGLSAEQRKAWQGYGRWEKGLVGDVRDFPHRTFFAAELLSHPPHYLTVQGSYVRFTTRNGTALYRLEGLPHKNPLMRSFLETMGDGRQPAMLVSVR